MFVFPFLYKHEAKLVRKVLSGTSVSTSDGSTGYSWKKDSKSFFHFLNSLSLKYFSASSGPYATEGLWSVATGTGGRSSLKSAQNEKLEGGAMPWKDPYLSKLGFHFWGIFFFSWLCPTAALLWRVKALHHELAGCAPLGQSQDPGLFQRQNICFPWHKVTFELWSHQEPRVPTSHRSQI